MVQVQLTVLVNLVQPEMVANVAMPDALFSLWCQAFFFISFDVVIKHRIKKTTEKDSKVLWIKVHLPRNTLSDFLIKHKQRNILPVAPTHYPLSQPQLLWKGSNQSKPVCAIQSTTKDELSWNTV